MELGEQEIQAVEHALNKIEHAVIELNLLDLAIVGGGSGAVSLG